MKPRKKGTSTLADGREVTDYVEQFPLPIRTHRPRKYVVVDMQTGQLWTADADDPTKVAGATEEDRKLIHQLTRK